MSHGVRFGGQGPGAVPPVPGASGAERLAEHCQKAAQVSLRAHLLDHPLVRGYPCIVVDTRGYCLPRIDGYDDLHFVLGGPLVSLILSSLTGLLRHPDWPLARAWRASRPGAQRPSATNCDVRAPDPDTAGAGNSRRPPCFDARYLPYSQP